MMRSVVALFLAALATSPLSAADQQVNDKRPTEIWNRTGPLGEISEHVTDEYPLSWSVGGVWVAPWRLADDYHVYGLEWTPEEIKYFVDGVLLQSVENTHWHQPLFMIFDSETMPNWFGMPEDDDLPSTFSVEYVRAWKKGLGADSR
jgi:hypothetical protein